jgi:Tfp pilus assembly protein PilN
MQLHANLASEPYRNRTPFWLGIAFLFLVTTVAGVAVVARSGAIDADAEQLQADVTNQEKEIADLQQQLADIKAEQQAAVITTADVVALDDARKLINRKSFSWSRLLVELEHYLPSRSRLTSIQVGAVSGTGTERVVQIKLSLEGMEQRQVAEVLMRFDRSGGRFRAEPASIQPSETGPSVTYDLNVQFRPDVAVDLPLPQAERVLTSNPPGGSADEEEGEQ